VQRRIAQCPGAQQLGEPMAQFLANPQLTLTWWACPAKVILIAFASSGHCGLRAHSANYRHPGEGRDPSFNRSCL
jgi:hypothetical protein